MEENAQNSKADNELKPLHTFQSDVEELMAKQQVSKAAIAIAESEKQRREETGNAPQGTPSFKPSKVFNVSSALPLSRRWDMKPIILVAIGVIVLGGIGVGAFFFFRQKEEPVTMPKPAPKAVAGVALQGNERRAGVIGAIQKTLLATSVPQNEMRTVPLTWKEKPITTSELFTILDTSPPPELVRALGSSPTLGLHGFKGGQPFLLFSVTSYDYAFGGMLSWEKTLVVDIGPLLGVLPRDILANVGSTTTEALENTLAIKDAIIRNKDARAVFDPSGAIVFLYSFIDKQTLVLTTNEDTLKMLINKAGGGKLRQ